MLTIGEQRPFEALVVAVIRQRPPKPGSLGALQVVKTVDWPIEQLRAICRCPNPSSYLSRSTSLILRMDNLLAGNLIPPFSGRFACRVVIQRRPLFELWKSFRDQADHESGIGR